MDTLYERGLAPLPKSEGSEKLIRHYHEQFHWPLAAAILLLLAEMFLPERRTPARPVRQKHPTSNLRWLRCWLHFCWCRWPSRLHLHPRLRDYHTGNYTNALEEFERLAEVRHERFASGFNAGAAAYRATNFDAARRLFQSATLSPDLQLQQKAFYNLGNAQYRLGELKFDPDSDSLNAMEETWTEAAQSYAHAFQLNTNDLDAACNLAFVKRQME